MGRTWMRRWPARLLVTALCLGCVSGCRFPGLVNMPLPFSAGRGDNGYTIIVDMANVGNLVPNSEVKVGDITVGTVTKVAFDNWHARLDVALQPTATLPVGTTAKIGMKSVLGAEYLDLMAPPGRTTGPFLGQGSVIPLTRTGRYPETEEVLAAASLLLNGGGLGQIQTITTELNTAFAGRTPQVRDSIPRLAALFGSLEKQRGQLDQAIDSADRLSVSLAKGNQTIDNAVDVLGPGLKIFADQRPDLTRTVHDLGRLSDQARALVQQGNDGIRQDLNNLQPVAKSLADSGSSLVEALDYLTAPIPRDRVPVVVHGNSFNFDLILDATADSISQDWLPDTPVSELLNRNSENRQFSGTVPDLPLVSPGKEPALGQTPSPTGPLELPLLGGDHSGPGVVGPDEKKPGNAGTDSETSGRPRNEGAPNDEGGPGSGDRTGGLLPGTLLGGGN